MSTKFKMKANKKVPHTVIRNGIYYFRIAIPKHLLEKYRDPETGKLRTQIWETLDTRDPDEALQKVGPALSKWRQQFKSEAIPTDEISYPILQQTSASFAAPFTYAYAGDFLSASISNSINIINERYEAKNTMNNLNKRQVAAIVGATETPALTFKDAFDRFKKLSPEKELGKNEVEAKLKWRRYERATEEWIEAMGDIDVLKITKKDVFEYRAKLIARIVKGDFKSDAANKNLMWLKLIVKTVFASDYPEKINPFEGVKITGIDDEGKREPFNNDEVSAILTALKTSGANDEAKAIIRIGACTGAAAKELVWLAPEDIVLDADVPYIDIRPNQFRKKIKTGGDRHRQIPLVGDALEAIKAFPNGFTRYQDAKGPTRLNATLGEIISPVVPGKSFYSFRHTVADALRNSGCNDTLKNSIMGHTSSGHQMHYGNGYSLEMKRDALKKALNI